jgi:polyisoprenyl-phosphate glycosyltransferase
VLISLHFLERVAAGESWAAVAARLPHRDALRLFKIALLQRWTEAPPDELLAQLDDRISWRRFCGFDATEPIPDLRALHDFQGELPRELLEEIAGRWTEPLISVVSPVYRAAEVVDDFVASVRKALDRITTSYEIVLVEDGSGDGTWARIAAACVADPRVKGVKLSRNFGQHPAITAGLERARGRYVVVIDCDLQDDPAFVADLYAKAQEGHHVVLTTRSERAHGFVKNALARGWVAVLNRLGTARSADRLVGGYSMLSRRAVDAFLAVRDVHRHYLLIVRWLGFDVAYVPVVHRQRLRGRSSYTLTKMIRHAVDGWVSHSNRLLYASVALGFSFLFAAIAGALLVVILYFVRGFAQGWPSLVVLILVSTGSILVSLGVLGIYVGKIFDQVRARPLYIVEQTLNG